MPKVSHPLTARLKDAVVETKKRDGPVWRGPAEDGITYSLLCRFLTCRERFRLLVVEGLRGAPSFEPAIEFGQMWHAAEEALAEFGNHNDKVKAELWQVKLLTYCKGLIKLYPMQQQQINHWYNIAKTAFPLYVQHWSRHPDVKWREPLLQEQAFDVPYELPSGRTIRLRGKWDSVDLIQEGANGKNAGIYIQENKTKSGIDQNKLTRQVSFDLQTLIYMVALEIYQKNLGVKDGGGFHLKTPIRGVRYNVIKRSTHKQGKKESAAGFSERLKGLILEAPNEWFARWKIELLPADVTKFRRECLDPLLENLCDWWGYITENQDPFYNGGGRGTHWRHPFGIRNVLDEGGASDLDAYLEGGSEIGLQRVDELFPELK